MRAKSATLLSVMALAMLMGAAPASDPIQKLGAWNGRWTFTGQIYKTKYSNAHADTGVADCTWSANKGYMSCEFFSDNPPHDDIAVMTYNSATRGYTLTNIHQDGRPTSTSPLSVNGDTWTTSSKVVDSGKTLVFRTTFVFVKPNEQTTTVEVSADSGQTWTRMIHVTAVKP